MRLEKSGIAGTLESSDVMVTVRPNPAGGVEIAIDSAVKAQYGDEMTVTVQNVLRKFGVTDAVVELQDRGALDCVIRARTETALCRALDVKYPWKEADGR